MPPPLADVSAELGARFEALRVAYERFILGLERMEPSALRATFLKDLRQALSRPPKNTAQNFRLQSLKGRVATFETYWNRSVLAKESTSAQTGTGAHSPSVASAKAVVSESTEAKDASSLRPLFEHYADKARQAKQQPPSYDAFCAMVLRQVAGIKERTGWQDVGFKVVDNQGRPALQAFRRDQPGSP